METAKAGSVAKQRVDQLNDFRVCDPDIRLDVLPQPFRFINAIVEGDLLSEVYKQVFQLEKDKNDKNFDGSLKEIGCQHTFELDQLVCLGEDSSPAGGVFVGGDKSGNVVLLDSNKRAQVGKKDVASGRRIIHIASSTTAIGQFSVTTIAVIARGHGRINLYRYKKGEFRLVNIGDIVLSDNAKQDTPTTNYAYSAEFSLHAQFLTVHFYSGRVAIYQVPALPERKLQTNKIKEDMAQYQDEQGAHHQNQQSKINENDISSKSWVLSVETPFVQIKIPFGIIEPPTISEIRPFEQTFRILKKSKFAVSPPAEEKKEDPKKKDAKKEAKTEVKQEKKAVQSLYVERSNQKTKFEQFVVQKGRDVSHDVRLPLIRPITRFINQSIVIPNPEKKWLARPDLTLLPTKLVVSFTGTKQVRLYSFQQGSVKNLPQYLKGSGGKPRQQPKLKQERKVDVIYPVKAMAVSKDSANLAVGLADGSIILFDGFMLIERATLERHKEEVTCLAFFQGRLVSGAKDGSVHLYQGDQGEIVMARKNVFKSKKPIQIVSLRVSATGLAAVLDSSCSLKLYDLWRGQKIGKMVPQLGQLPNTATKEWMTVPQFATASSDSQLLILSTQCFPKQGLTEAEVKLQEQIVERPYRRLTKIHVFKYFQAAIQVYEGLYNIWKKVGEKTKVLSCLSHLEMGQLQDKHFELPVFGFQTGAIKSGQSIGKKSKGSKGDSLSNSISSTKRDKSKKKPDQLTQQQLHPEKFLFKKKNLGSELAYTPQTQVARLRERQKERGRREDDVSKGLAAFRQELQQRQRQEKHQ